MFVFTHDDDMYVCVHVCVYVCISPGTQGATDAVFPFGFVQLASWIAELTAAQVCL